MLDLEPNGRPLYEIDIWVILWQLLTFAVKFDLILKFRILE